MNMLFTSNRLQVVSVCSEKGYLVLGGADIVNGSPILDIKPYVPFADAVPTATAPPWVQVCAFCGCCPNRVCAPVSAGVWCRMPLHTFIVHVDSDVTSEAFDASSWGLSSLLRSPCSPRLSGRGG